VRDSPWLLGSANLAADSVLVLLTMVGYVCHGEKMVYGVAWLLIPWFMGILDIMIYNGHNRSL
jgi:hypothetical protein